MVFTALPNLLITSNGVCFNRIHKINYCYQSKSSVPIKPDRASEREGGEERERERERERESERERERESESESESEREERERE